MLAKAIKPTNNRIAIKKPMPCCCFLILFSSCFLFAAIIFTWSTATLNNTNALVIFNSLTPLDLKTKQAIFKNCYSLKYILHPIKENLKSLALDVILRFKFHLFCRRLCTNLNACSTALLLNLLCPGLKHLCKHIIYLKI